MTISELRVAERSAFGPFLATPLLREGIPIGAIHDPPHGGPPVHREANQAARNLRRPSRDRHRERASVPRIGGADARAGAIGRGAESVRRSRPSGQLYSRSSDRAQHHRRPRGPALRNRRRSHLRVRRSCARVSSQGQPSDGEELVEALRKPRSARGKARRGKRQPSARRFKCRTF